jgi:hypothetical protein
VKQWETIVRNFGLWGESPVARASNRADVGMVLASALFV